MKTQAAVLINTKEPLKLLEIDLPELSYGQVLVEMHYSGICRSQLNEIFGHKGEDKYLPHTLGHEGAGKVIAIGPGVKKVQVSDHVIVTWIKGTGLDVSSTTYSSALGTVNSGPVSTFLEKAVISENRLIPIPKSFSLKHAALFGCAIPTGAGIVYNECQLTKDATVAIFGLGGIGLSSLLAASAKEAKQIIAVDVFKDKEELAKRFGAHHFIDASQGEVLEAIHALTNGQGVDFSIEAVGIKEVMETAFASVKAGGGMCVIAGNVPSGTKISVDPFDFIKGKRLIGTWGGKVNPDLDIPEFLQKFAEKSERLDAMISHEGPLEKINQLINLVSEGKAARALVRFNS